MSTCRQIGGHGIVQLKGTVNASLDQVRAAGGMEQQHNVIAQVPMCNGAVRLEQVGDEPAMAVLFPRYSAECQDRGR